MANSKGKKEKPKTEAELLSELHSHITEARICKGKILALGGTIPPDDDPPNPPHGGSIGGDDGDNDEDDMT